MADAEHWQYVKFGKYKGTLWSDVPEDYLRWCAKNFDAGYGKKLVTRELRRRKERAHCERTWRPPRIPHDMTDEQRMSQFHELVDISCGTVYSVERWHHLPLPESATESLTDPPTDSVEHLAQLILGFPGEDPA